MFKKTLGALLLSSCGLTAHAAIQSFEFSFSSPDWQWSHNGKFSADDVNADGIFSKDEVTAFRFDHVNFLPAPGWGTRTIESFSYQPGSTLAFVAKWKDSASHNGIFNFPGSASQWAYYESDFWCDGMGGCYWPERFDYGSDNVTFAITNTTPVPEPESWLMLGAGLAVVGAARRKFAGKRTAA